MFASVEIRSSSINHSNAMTEPSASLTVLVNVDDKPSEDMTKSTEGGLLLTILKLVETFVLHTESSS